MPLLQSRPWGRKKLFQQRRTGWIGIDVGTCALKMAQVEKVGSQWRIGSSLIVPNGERRVLDDNSVSEGWIHRAIHSGLTASHEFQGRRAACLLPMSAIEVRSLKLPDTSDEELREMIAGEFDSSPGRDSQDREFDFWKIETTPKVDQDGMAHLIALSVSRRVAGDLTADVFNAGLKCEVLDGLPFALARAINMVSPQSSELPVAAVDWGFTTAAFTVVAGGIPVFTRNLRECGLEHLMRTVSDGLELSDQECEQILTTYGIPHPGANSQPSNLQQAIFDLATEPLSEMVDELIRTLSYLRQHQSAFFPTRIWMFGGGAAIHNVAEFLASKTGVPIEVWRLAGRSTDSDQQKNSKTALLGPAAALSALASES